jgi:hypothetical protein
MLGRNPSGYGKFNLQDQHSRQVAEAWPPDPYWDKVVLLLHGDGTNGSPNILAHKGGAPTPIGNAGIYTTYKKFGTGALSFDGSGDNLSGLSRDFVFGTDDFTVEFWANPTDGGHGGSWSRMFQIGANSQNGGLWIVCTNTDNPCRVLCQTYNSGYVTVGDSVNTLTNGTWTHVALSRQGTTYRLFFNGVQESSITTASGADISNSYLYIGSNNTGTEAFKGYLDEIRVTRGIARYTAAFTPPTGPFPNG